MPLKPDRLTLTFVMGSVAAGALVATMHGSSLAWPFDGEAHAWGSAHFATIGRSYAEQGFVALRGLPVGNNPPLGREPDAYLHWPPLFSMLLGLAFQGLGVSEAVARGFVLLVGAAVVASTAWVVKLACGSRAAAAATFAVLTTPVFFHYVRLVQLTTSGLLFMLIGLAAFLKATAGEGLRKRWMGFGLAAAMLSVLSSWEPLFLPAGLLAASLLQRNRARLRLSLAYGAAAAAGALLVLGFYGLSMPGLLGDLWGTALFRSGLGAYTQPEQPSIHSLVNQGRYLFQLGTSDRLRILSVHFLDGLGWVHLLAIGGALALSLTSRKKSAEDAKLLLLALLAPVGLWYVLLSNQVIDNDFEVLLAVPLAAASFAILLSHAWDAAIERIPRPLQGALWGAVALLVLGLLRPVWGAAQEMGDGPPRPTGMLEYAAAIRDNTGPDAVVLSPLPSLVPVFYSRRHVIRNVGNDSAVWFVLERVGTVFPGSAVYLALPGPGSGSFRRSVADGRLVVRDRRLTLIALRE